MFLSIETRISPRLEKLEEYDKQTLMRIELIGDDQISNVHFPFIKTEVLKFEKEGNNLSMYLFINYQIAVCTTWPTAEFSLVV